MSILSSLRIQNPEAACRARLARVAAWLTELARGDATPSALVAFGHQTVFDLLVQLLETGSGDRSALSCVELRVDTFVRCFANYCARWFANCSAKWFATVLLTPC